MLGHRARWPDRRRLLVAAAAVAGLVAVLGGGLRAFARPGAKTVTVPAATAGMGSFLCTDEYCGRYRPGTRGKGEPSSGANHLGFRTVRVVSR